MSSRVLLPAGQFESFGKKCESKGVAVIRTNHLTPQHERVQRPVLRRYGHKDVIGMKDVLTALQADTIT